MPYSSQYRKSLFSRAHTTLVPWKDEKITEQVKTKSVEPQQRFTLSEVAWDELNEADAYVERGTGDLYRGPLLPRRD